MLKEIKEEEINASWESYPNGTLIKWDGRILIKCEHVVRKHNDWSILTYYAFCLSNNEFIFNDLITKEFIPIKDGVKFIYHERTK